MCFAWRKREELISMLSAAAATTILRACPARKGGQLLLRNYSARRRPNSLR
jgi:hypothetical protein